MAGFVHLLLIVYSPAPNTANTQWNFTAGQIKLISNPSLCLTGPPSVYVNAYPLTVEQCIPANPSQHFIFEASDDEPSVTIMQGSSSVGVLDNYLVLYYGVAGTVLETCNSGNAAQGLKFTGTNNTIGLLQTASGQCVRSGCDGGSCYPAVYFECDPNDGLQRWYYNGTTAMFHNVQTQYCLDAQGGYV